PRSQLLVAVLVPEDGTTAQDEEHLFGSEVHMGRLGDMYGKKRVLVVTLSGLAAGSLLAAVVTSLPLMIVARTIQGLGGALFPLAFGIIRDELPRERVAGAIALVSGILGIGGGLGIVLAGPILQHLSYHWLFWIPFVVTA